MNARTLRFILNVWPPFLFTGIRVTRLTSDYREADVTLTQHWYNRNFFGTHFGGSLFAMTDAMYALMLLQRLGRGYVVWDRRAAIEFLTPGRGVVTARFRVDDDVLEAVRARTATGEKYLPEFTVEVTDASGTVVARVMKTVYVRRAEANSAS